MKNIVKLFILLFVGSGCTESFIDEYREDPSNLSGETFWNNPINAENVLASAYVNLQDNSLYGRALHESHALMTHEADLDWLNFDYWNQFNTNAVTTRNPRLNELWRSFYEVIRDANDVIEHKDIIVPSDAYTQEKINDLLGQTYFIRAFTYQHLASLWSEAYPAENPNAPSVPLLLTVAKTENEFYAPRATVGKIYTQMEEDYKKAIELLPANDPRKTAEAGRISIYAAYGYLGKAYLYQEKYAQAAEQFEIVINSEHFELMDTMRHVYDGNHEFNSETILEWNYSDLSNGLATAYTGGTFQQFTLIHGPVEQTLFANFFVSDYSLERWGEDPRKYESVVMIGDRIVITKTGVRFPVRKHPVTRKFFNPNILETREPGFTTNIIPMRLSDVYLMYAEALNALGQDDLAAEYMNKVRRRAYFAPVDSPNDTVDYNVTGVALRDSIREERWRELHYEMHRWYDIQRWGIVEEEISKVTNSTSGPVLPDPYDKYWPIPEEQVRLNPKLVQNDGY